MFCVVCWQKKKKANQHVPALVTHLQGQRIVIVACGEAHTLGVTKQGSVWSWGHGKTGALRMDTGSHSLVPIPIESRFLGHSKTVRVSSVPPRLALAFASLTHSRLGQVCLSFPSHAALVSAPLTLATGFRPASANALPGSGLQAPGPDISIVSRPN